jgi:hypothetical protein
MGPGGRGRGRTGPAALDQLQDPVAHLGFQGTELVLHIDPVLAAQGEQVFALHVQFTRQSKNADFLVWQAQLPVLTTRAPTTPAGPFRVAAPSRSNNP